MKVSALTLLILNLNSMIDSGEYDDSLVSAKDCEVVHKTS